MTTAEFEIEASPYADRGYDATEDQVVSLALADPSLDVYTVRYSIVGKTKYAPASFTFSPSTGIAATPSTPVTLDVGSPTEVGRPHSLRVRCQINGGRNPDGTINTEFTKDRIIAVRNPVGLRSVVVGETLDYDPEFGWFGWAEEIADVAGGSFTLSNATPTEVGDTGDATPGGGTDAAREGHRHEHGNRGGGTLHLAATSLLAGFMSAADKATLDAATSAPTASALSKRDAGGNIQYVVVSCTAVSASGAVETPLIGVDTIQEGPGGADVALGSSVGAVNLTGATGASVTATTGALGLSALAGALNVSASTTCAIQATDVELSGEVLITPTTECFVDGRFKASSTFVANAEGVSIGPSAVAPGATQNGAIQLSTAAPTGNPADINNVWMWYDGGEGGDGIDTRAFSGRPRLNIGSVIADTTLTATTSVTATTELLTPEVRALTLDLDLRHEAGGKFDFKRGATSYAQLTNDGAGTTTLEETGSGALLIESSAAVTVNGSSVVLGKTGGTATLSVTDSGGSLVTDANATWLVRNTGNVIALQSGTYVAAQTPVGTDRFIVGGSAYEYSTESAVGLTSDTNKPTAKHVRKWNGTGGLRKIEEAFGSEQTTATTQISPYTSPALPAGTIHVSAVVTGTTAAGAASGSWDLRATIRGTGSASALEGAVTSLHAQEGLGGASAVTIAANATNQFEVQVTPGDTTATRWDVFVTMHYGGPHV